MAVDSREKRQSAVSFLIPSYPPGVEPSSLDNAARQAAVWVYSGILSGAAALVAKLAMVYYRRRRGML